MRLAQGKGQLLASPIALILVFNLCVSAAAAQPSGPSTSPTDERDASAEVSAPNAPNAATPSSSGKPWAEGVSEEAQSSALAKFKEGNDFFSQRQYAEALKLYKDALQFWPHPAIFFNTAVCQVNLDQPIDAYRNIQAALKYESAPLGDDLYAQALTYQKLLTDRLGQIRMKADQKGAVVSLDGEQIMTAPASHEQILLPGKHQVVAELKGYLTFTKAVQVDPGAPTELEIVMIPLDQATEFERPMPVWLPWTVAGGGVVVGLAGLGMRSIAGSQFSEYDSGFASACPDGCPANDIPEDLQNTESSAKAWDVASIATMSVGAAALVTGVTLLILNGPRPVQPEEHDAVMGQLDVQPLVGADFAALSVSGSF